MKKSNLYSVVLLTLGILLSGHDLCAQAKLTSIAFSSKKWTPEFLRRTIPKGKAAIIALSDYPSQVRMGSGSFNDNENQVDFSFDREGWSLSLKPYYYQDPIPDTLFPLFSMETYPIQGFDDISDARFDYQPNPYTDRLFYVNDNPIKIGDYLDDFPFLTAWEQSYLDAKKTYYEAPDFNGYYNYVILIGEDGSAVKLSTGEKDGWRSRRIRYMEYVEDMRNLSDLIDIFTSNSHDELVFMKEQVTKIVKASPSKDILLYKLDGFIANSINEGSFHNAMSLEEQRRYAARARQMRKEGTDALMNECEQRRELAESEEFMRKREAIRQVILERERRENEEAIKNGRPLRHSSAPPIP